MTLARDVTTVGAATLTSRLLGFLRDAGIAAILGAGVLSDAYFAALQIPNLFRRLLAEGALNSAFVPMWIRIREESGPEGTRRFGEQALGAMARALGLVAVLCLLGAPLVVHVIAPGFESTGERFPLAVTFVRLSVPYVALSGVVAVAASALNAEGRVAAAAFGLVVFNGVLLATVAALILLHAEASPAAAGFLAGSVAAAGAAQLICVGFAWMRTEERPRRLAFSSSPAVRRFLVQALPGVLAGGIPQLKLMAGAMVASSSQAAVSWLYYANRLYELPLGVISIAISSVMVPAIAASLRSGDRDAAAASQSRALELALALSLPAATGFAVLSQAIAGGLFERGAFGARDTAMVAAALAAISAGLPGHSLEKVLGAVSFAHEDTRTPMYAALCGLATAVIGSLLLFPYYGHVGIAGAIAISGWVGATLLAIILRWRGWLRIEQASFWRLPRIVIATAIMAAVVGAGEVAATAMFDLSGSSLARIVTLFVLVGAGLAIYLAALHIFRVMSLRELVAAVGGGKA
jgi:putative peptidoglycan lipid II flippase